MSTCIGSRVRRRSLHMQDGTWRDTLAEGRVKGANVTHTYVKTSLLYSRNVLLHHEIVISVGRVENTSSVLSMFFLIATNELWGKEETTGWNLYALLPASHYCFHGAWTGRKSGEDRDWEEECEEPCVPIAPYHLSASRNKNSARRWKYMAVTVTTIRAMVIGTSRTTSTITTFIRIITTQLAR